MKALIIAEEIENVCIFDRRKDTACLSNNQNMIISISFEKNSKIRK